MRSGEGALAPESPPGPFSQRNSVDMALLPMHPPADPRPFSIPSQTVHSCRAPRTRWSFEN